MRVLLRLATASSGSVLRSSSAPGQLLKRLSTSESNQSAPYPRITVLSEQSMEKITALAERIYCLSDEDLKAFVAHLAIRVDIPDDCDVVARYKTDPPISYTNAAAPQSVQQPVAAPEKASFDVKLVGYNAASKIKVIKEVRALMGLGLKEAKDVVEGIPYLLKKNLRKDEADALIAKMKEIGAECSVN